MKSWALVVSLLVACALPAFARLGETSAELAERFGAGNPPTEINGWYQQQIFHMNGFDIRVCLIDDASVAEQYTPHGGPMTKPQIDTLLQINSQGHKWALQPRGMGTPTTTHWQRDDGADAMLSMNSFTVNSKRFIEGEAAFRKAQAPSVDGF